MAGRQVPCPEHVLRAIRGEVPREEKKEAYNASLNKCAALTDGCSQGQVT